MEDLKRQEMIRHIGITAHKIGVAEEAVNSGLNTGRMHSRKFQTAQVVVPARKNVLMALIFQIFSKRITKTIRIF